MNYREILGSLIIFIFLYFLHLYSVVNSIVFFTLAFVMKVVASSDELFPFWNKFITIKNDCIFQQSSMAEDMGLELVKKAQALKFQGGNTPSTLVPRVVPKY